MTRLLISAMAGQTRAAWLDHGRPEGGRLVDLVILRGDKPSFADNLYLGRVTALDKGLKAGFVDIGLERPGLLPLAEAPKNLTEGDSVIVRVKRAPSAGKGARLTARLKNLAPAVAEAAARAKPPRLLYAAADPIVAILTGHDAPEQIVIDDPAFFARVRQALAARPDLLDRLALDLGAAPLFEREGVEEEIDALLDPFVPLPSGGSLLIEPVRTLTAIDVNSGGADGRGGAKAVQSLDLEAAVEIARQIRLRDLSGLIVIDFLELADLAARKVVVQALKSGLKGDAQPSRIYDMRPSGLVEMTRRRARPPLHELLTEPCGVGAGGRVKDPVTCAFEALHAVRRAAAQEPDRRVAVLAPPRILAALTPPNGPAARARAALEERLGRPLELRSARGGETFEIVLE